MGKHRLSSSKPKPKPKPKPQPKPQPKPKTGGLGRARTFINDMVIRWRARVDAAPM